MACRIPALLFLTITGFGLLAAGPAAASKADKTTPTLRAFADEQAFERQLAAWRRHAEATQKAQVRRYRMAAASPPLPSAPAPAMAAMEMAATASDSAAPAADAESITNVQTAGVDEGGIVKRHGDHLVILRRGRLFTVRVGDDRLQPVATVDAFAPGSDPGGAWYDEMLIGRDTVVVVGYSYARGGTELVLFDIDRAGALRYRDTWHLRSNDYYASRNFASRLVGDTLVFYAPMRLDLHGPDFAASLPGMRRWVAGSAPDTFRRILPATRIYRSDDALDPVGGGITLHTVTRCDLAKRDLDCTSSAVLGPSGRVFYVSADSVYVWTTGAGRNARNTASVFRMPLDGGAPTGLKAQGVPIDQLSFLQDAGGHLNVLLSGRGQGEGMWGQATSTADLALLRVPLSRFGDGSQAAPASAYRPLPDMATGTMQNRFVGDWLLYGSASPAWGPRDDSAGSQAYALRYAANDAVQRLDPMHGVERIEALGRDALLVGSAGTDLHFTSLRLGTRADIASRYVQRDAAQGETRTHGFFHRAETAERGIVGLPILAQRPDVMQRYLQGAASVLYLRNRNLALTPMGSLAAHAERAVDDACQASCVDWYGNARPIFLGSRVFALLGYELVEGRVAGERIVERRRIDVAPALAIAR